MPEDVFRTSVYLGTVNGKKKYKSLYAKSKKELDQKVRKVKAEIEAGKNAYTKATFSVWADKWYNEIEVPKGISEKTLEQIKYNLKRLNESFGSYELKKINLSMFQIFINDLARENPNTGKPTAKRTLKGIKETAENVFSYASANNIAGVPNFFKFVSIPASAPEEKRRALTIDEQNMIINTPHDAQLPAMIMMFAGLRRGEVIPLEWSDIDLKKGIISVSKSVDMNKNKTSVKAGGKTKNAVRLVPIPPILIDYLTEYKKNTKVLSKNVCLSKSGKLYTYSAWRSLWSSYLTDLNAKYGYAGMSVNKFDPHGLPMKIEKFTAHYLRHTFATLLYLQNVDSTSAMQYLGHANIQTTVDVYTDIEHANKLGISDEYKRRLSEEYRIKTA